MLRGPDVVMVAQYSTFSASSVRYICELLCNKISEFTTLSPSLLGMSPCFFGLVYVECRETGNLAIPQCSMSV